MIRERVARAALQAFPREIRSARGAEMLGTLLDASATSRVRFAREIVDLVRSGLRARARRTVEAGARRVVADGLCLGGVWLLTLFFASELGNMIKGFDPWGPWVPMAPWTLALLGAGLVLGLIGYDRLAGATALAFMASVFADPARYDLTTRDRSALLVPVFCFVALLLAPRRRQPDPRRLAWLVLVAALAVAAGTRPGDDTMAWAGLLPLLVLLIPVFALLWTDPRPAIAYTMWAAYFGVLIAQDPEAPRVLGVLFLAAAPLVLTIVIARTRRLQPRTLF